MSYTAAKNARLLHSQTIYCNEVFDTNWLKLGGKCNFYVIFGAKGRKVTKILQRARQYSCAIELGMW